MLGQRVSEQLTQRDPDLSPVSQIYRLIKDMANDIRGGPRRPRKRVKRMGKGPEGQRDTDADGEEEDEELSLVDVRARVLAAGFTEAQLQDCLIEVRGFSRTPSPFSRRC